VFDGIDQLSTRVVFGKKAIDAASGTDRFYGSLLVPDALNPLPNFWFGLIFDSVNQPRSPFAETYEMDALVLA
jgi:hypothetical protein